MSDGFQHDIAGGAGALIITSLHSPNYVPGVSGWAIFRDGSAEFNSGTFRGFIVGGSLFIYTGAPALGNPPILAITSAATDPFGNSIRPGDANAAAPFIALGPAPAGGTASFIQLVGGALVSLLMGTGDSAETAPGSVSSTITGAAGARTYQTVVQAALNALSGIGQLILTSGSVDGTTTGSSAQLLADDSHAMVYVGGTVASGANPQVLTQGGLYQVNNQSGGAPFRISRTPLTLVGGFAAVAGELAPSVFLDPLNGGQLVFAGRMTVPAAPNSVDFAVLPAGLFSPNTPFSLPTTSRRAPLSYLGGAALAGSPRLFMSSAGHLQLSGIPAGGAGNDVDLGGAVIRLA